MPSFMDMMTMRAIENIGALLIDPDPYVRLQASLAVLEFSTPWRLDTSRTGTTQMNDPEDMNVAAGHFEDGYNARDRDDMAELNEFPENDDGTDGAGYIQQSEEEVLERLAAAEQATGERIPPAAERAGRSPLGSGEQRR